MPAKWKGDNKSIAKVREECARDMQVQEYFFFFLRHFRVGGSAALALFVPLQALLFLLLLIWYPKIVALSQQTCQTSALLNGSLSLPVKAAKGQNSFHSIEKYLLFKVLLWSNEQYNYFFQCHWRQTLIS